MSEEITETTITIKHSVHHSFIDAKTIKECLTSEKYLTIPIEVVE